MHPIIFSFGNVHIYGYGLMIAIGLIAAVSFALLRTKKYGLDGDILFNMVAIGLIFGAIGSKLLFIIVELKRIIENPKMLLDFGSGWVAYGGLILGAIAPIVYANKFKKTSGLKYLDFAMPSFALGQAFGRIGCFLAGCCYGAPAPEGAWYAVTFPAESLSATGTLYPTQLWSSMGDFVIFAVLWFALTRNKFRGQIVSLYMILYSIGRFIIEFFRNDPRGSVGVLSTSQFIAIFILAAGLALYVFMKKKNLEPLKVTKEEQTESKETA